MVNGRDFKLTVVTMDHGLNAAHPVAMLGRIAFCGDPGAVNKVLVLSSDALKQQQIDGKDSFPAVDSFISYGSFLAFKQLFSSQEIRHSRHIYRPIK